MVSGSFTEVLASPISCDRLWKAGVLDMPNLMPKILNQFIASVEVLEGNGGPGTVTKFNLTEAAGFGCVKDRVDVLDMEKKILKYTTIEGGLIGERFKSLTYETKFDVDGEGKSVGTVTFSYETADDNPLSDEEKVKISEPVLGMMKAVEGYLLADPTAYA